MSAAIEREQAFLAHIKKKVLPVTEQIEQQKDRFRTNSQLSLLINLAREGKRELNMYKPFTAVDVMQACRDHADDLHQHLSQMTALIEQLETAMHEANPEYDKLNRCPICKGTGGWTSKMEGKDCHRCQGRGTV